MRLVVIHFISIYEHDYVFTPSVFSHRYIDAEVGELDLTRVGIWSGEQDEKNQGAPQGSRRRDQGEGIREPRMLARE